MAQAQLALPLSPSAPVQLDLQKTAFNHALGSWWESRRGDENWAFVDLM